MISRFFLRFGLLTLIAFAFAYCNSGKAAGSMQTSWSGGTGYWADAGRWSAGLPNVFKKVSVGGKSTVLISKGSHEAGVLDVGTQRGDRARLELNGGRLLVRQDSLVIGQSTDSQGTFLLNEGTVESVMDIFVGGPTAVAGTRTKAALVINGGNLVGLSFIVGEGLGAESTLSIQGTRATSISALEFVSIEASVDPGGKAGQSTLSFTIDERGVTPITIQSRWRGLQIEHDDGSHCNLRIALSAVPPREDVTLISSKVANRGTFDGLPEGSDIAAQFQGRTYRWALTYRGGSSGHDLVLRNRSDYYHNAPVNHVSRLTEIPKPLWWGHSLYPLFIDVGWPAFPGAEGYGAYTPGGRGGRKLYVDNLNDSGAGSLRAAVEAAGPRIVIFRKSGKITLNSTLVLRNPYITLDGENAPTPGILLYRHGIEVRTHDVILRQFRIRIGDEDVRRNDGNIRYAAGDGEYALDFVAGSRNCIADHLSLSWSTNKLLSTTKMSDLITIQWCILSESLNLDGHGYASITGGNRVSWHHNLFAHNYSRNVRFQGAVDADFRNNVIYDWGEKSAYGEFDRLNYVGNYLKPGPSTTQNPLLFMDGEEVVAPGSLFLYGNRLEGNQRATLNNWKGTAFYFDRTKLEAAQPFPAPPVTTESASTAYDLVLEKAGATQPRRDAVDARIIDEVRTSTGHIVESVAAVGGSPNF